MHMEQCLEQGSLLIDIFSVNQLMDNLGTLKQLLLLFMSLPITRGDAQGWSENNNKNTLGRLNLRHILDNVSLQTLRIDPPTPPLRPSNVVYVNMTPPMCTYVNCPYGVWLSLLE